MTRERVFSVVSGVTGCPVDRLSEDTALESLENWDSLKYLSLVLRLEEEFGVKFSESEVVDMGDMRAILAAVEAKTAK